MSNLNKATLIGRVGQDPNIKQFENGDKVANLSLATSERWKTQQGEPREQTEWHSIVVQGKLADVVQNYVKKGDLLYVEGKIKTRSYDDKDGIKRYMTEIVVGFTGTIQMFPKPKLDQETTGAAAPVQNNAQAVQPQPPAQQDWTGNSPYQPAQTPLERLPTPEYNDLPWS